jgi:monomeric isocitrate dehydrogenase
VSLAVLAGCGSDGASTDEAAVSPEEEMQAVSDTVISYLSAALTGDPTACEKLTTGAQAQLLEEYNASNLATFQGGDASDCEAAVEAFGSFVLEQGGQTAEDMVSLVEGTTDSSRVELISETEATINVDQAQGPAKDYELVKEGDTWLLAKPYIDFT